MSRAVSVSVTQKLVNHLSHEHNGSLTAMLFRNWPNSKCLHSPVRNIPSIRVHQTVSLLVKDSLSIMDETS